MEQSGTRHHIFKIPDIHKDIISCMLVKTQLVPLYLGPGACMSIRCMGDCVLSLRLAQLSGQRFSWPANSCCSSPPQHEVRPPIIDAPYVLERACM